MKRYLIEIEAEDEALGANTVGWLRELVEDSLMMEGGVAVTRIEPEEISEYDRQRTGEAMRHGDWFTARLLRLVDSADVKNRARIRIAFPETVALYEDWLRG